MDRMPLSLCELESTKCGEAISLAGVMAIMVIAIITVVIYKLYTSGDGTVQLPGGYKFQRK